MGCGSSAPVREPTPEPPTPTPPPPTPTPPPPTPTPPLPTPPRTPTPRPVTPPLPPDKVEIRIDKGVDENEISSTEESYPYPAPPSKDTKEIKPKDTFFDDAEFINASDDADLFETEAATDDISLSNVDYSLGSDCIDEKERGKLTKPRPTTGIKPSLTFGKVDEHAQQAGAATLESFKALTDYLSSPWKRDKYREIKTARAIVMWMSQQNLDGGNVDGESSIETPRGLVQYLKQQRMTYPTCYAILCRHAGLQCTVIKGNVKAARYEPGDDSVPGTNWNAVYGECGWQIVHPFWICRALYGHNLGGWVKVEADGTRTHQREQSSVGVVRNTFQERYFMPKPEEFLYECYAQLKDWQLVEPAKEIKSEQDFLAMPYLLPPFHSLGLQLVSEQQCVMESKNGFCRIEFQGRTTNSHMLLLKYELFRKDTDEDTDTKDKVSRMVFNSRANEHFIFDIRFPEEGVYKLVIYGGPYKSTALRLCEFKIVCKQKMKGFDLLPLECGNIGWGPSPVTMEAGLLMPSKPNGLITVNKNDKKICLSTEIKFRIRDDFVSKHEYSAAIHTKTEGKIDGSDAIRDTTQTVISTHKHISLTITAEFEFVISIKLPEEGEFGVTIHEQVVFSEELREKTVCNYLVSTKAYHGMFMKANITLAKQALTVACNEQASGQAMKKKIEHIHTALNKCRNQNIPAHDEDVCVAETTMEYLRCKDMLRDCILGRNYHVTMKALAIIARYRNKAALMKMISKVQKLRDQMYQERRENHMN